MEISVENLYVILGLEGWKVVKKGQEIFRGCLKLANVVQDQVELEKKLFWMNEHYGKSSGKIKKC